MLANNHVVNSRTVIHNCVRAIKQKDFLYKLEKQQENDEVISNMSDFGLGYEGYVMVPSIRHIASMIWKRSVVLSLIRVRFCDSMSIIDN